MLALIGLLVVVAALVVGVYWLVTNVSFSRRKNYRYERFTSEAGETLEKVIEVDDEKA